MTEKMTHVDEHFRPVLGMRPWKAKLGIGSFLTFEFGPRLKAHGVTHGQWHLWIYLTNWKLFHRGRRLADSDADRKLIQVAIRRLEGAALTEVNYSPNSHRTTFVFDDFRLVTEPTQDSELDGRDYYWMFFLPNNEVLTLGPSGAQVTQADAVQHA